MRMAEWADKEKTKRAEDKEKPGESETTEKDASDSEQGVIRGGPTEKKVKRMTLSNVDPDDIQPKVEKVKEVVKPEKTILPPAEDI